MEFKVVQLTPKDHREYLTLRKESEIEFPQYVGPSAERELLAGEDNIASILESYPEEGTIVFGAFNNEGLVGVLALSRRLSPKFKHRAFIWGMYIDKSYRQSNVGALLLDYVKVWAADNKEVNVLWLQVTETNQPAISFYKKHGFITYGTEPMALFTQDEYHDVHYMQIMA
ncbi:MAG: GNAT family N-acetyltransferase [Pseudomonadales bacterium]|nr:GNAT family N-acetyltransferase [Pseudomonadales bacterium]